LPADGVSDAIADSKAKADHLGARTDAALALGVRGVPSLAAGDRLWYGDDQLEADAATLRRRLG
jgi:2-hydroxychromene-2-carboxylate isomerase